MQQFERLAKRKFYLLEDRSNELAQKLGEVVLGKRNKFSIGELEEVQDYLGILTGSESSTFEQGGGTTYAVCPALYRSNMEPENYYFRVPLDDVSGKHVTPKCAIEIVDVEELSHLDILFAGGEGMIFSHQHSRGPYIEENKPEELGL